MRICVISDLHVKYAGRSEDDSLNHEILLEFLRDAVGKYDLLVLNGDVFDLWFDWKYTIIKQFFPLLYRLAGLRDSGCRIVVVGGNHDFWFGDFFQTQLGAEVYPETYTLNADGKRMLFTHGDLHSVNDARYKLLRRILRFPGTKSLFSLLHPDLALGIGARMSRSSRFRVVSHALHNRKNAGLYHYASTQIQKNRFDIVCMGHSHKPQIRPVEHGFYVNSGDWIQHRAYVEIIDGKVELKEYKGDQK